MLKKQFRLPANTNFENSLKLKAPGYIIKVKKNNLDYSRFGFVVSKKIDKSAVKRNKIKRFFRSCIEINQDIIEKGKDFLFILNKKPEKDEKNLFCDSLLKLLKKESVA